MLEGNEAGLTERKVLRRGLMAGLAGLGAAVLLKLSGSQTREVSAANGDPIMIGAEQSAQSRTSLIASPGFNLGALLVRNGASAATPNVPIAIEGHTDANGAYSVYGRNDTLGGRGVVGESFEGIGVLGLGGTGAWAVVGHNSQNSTGVRGVSGSPVGGFANGTGSGIGVHGLSGSGPGVRGESTSGPGVEGISANSLGVRGTSTNFVGVVGISTNNHGLYGFTSSPSGAALVGDNAGGGLAGIFNGPVQIHGALQVFGAPKNAVIKMADGTNALVYCQESPEAYLEDFGRAQLVGGVANVAIEREFATLVAGNDYMVFITPQGPSGGLYVSRQTPGGFEVRDPGNGNVPFTYRIVTKRKDIEGKRFARVTDGLKEVAAARASLGVAGSPNVPPVPGPSAPPQFVPPPGPAPIAPSPTGRNDTPPAPRPPADGRR